MGVRSCIRMTGSRMWCCHCRQYDRLLQDFSSPAAGTTALKFETKYPKPFATQFRTVYDKYWAAYWRMPEYNGFRFIYAISIGFLFGAIFWRLGYGLRCARYCTEVVITAD